MATPARQIVPRFRVDLDKPPQERWIEVIEAYRSKMRTIHDMLDRLLRDALGEKKAAMLLHLGDSLLSRAGQRLLYADELRSIAKMTDISFGKVVAMQLVYEASACCTTFVVPMKGEPARVSTAVAGSVKEPASTVSSLSSSSASLPSVQSRGRQSSSFQPLITDSGGADASLSATSLPCTSVEEWLARHDMQDIFTAHADRLCGFKLERLLDPRRTLEQVIQIVEGDRESAKRIFARLMAHQSTVVSGDPSGPNRKPSSLSSASLPSVHFRGRQLSSSSSSVIGPFEAVTGRHSTFVPCSSVEQWLERLNMLDIFTAHADRLNRIKLEQLLDPRRTFDEIVPIVGGDQESAKRVFAHLLAQRSTVKSGNTCGPTPTSPPSIANAQLLEGIPIMARTMDWAMPFLQEVTCEVEFWQYDCPLFVATTWPGYVGVFTGMRQGAFSLAVNFRCAGGKFLGNAAAALGDSWPTGFIMRHALTTACSFDEAVNLLAEAKLIAPTYFTVCGVRRSEATLITRDRVGEAARFSQSSRWKMNELGAPVQTNVDHWDEEHSENDILFSFERRRCVQKEIHRRPLGWTQQDIWRVLSIEPILNDLTIYACITCPRTGLYETYLPDGLNGFEYAAMRLDGETNLQKYTGGNTRTAVGRHLRSNSKVTRWCIRCMAPYSELHNDGGQCRHSGQWHETVHDCSFGCALGLKSALGRQHWGCCFALDETQMANCSASDPHTDEPSN